MHDVPLHELGAADIVRLTHAGTLSAEAVVRACLERIAQREDTVGAWALAFELQTYPNQLSWALRKRIEAGQSCAPEVYDETRQIARDCRRAMKKVFSRFDAIIFPSALGAAPKGLQSTGNALFNRFWTALYGPVVTIPVGTGNCGMPLG